MKFPFHPPSTPAASASWSSSQPPSAYVVTTLSSAFAVTNTERNHSIQEMKKLSPSTSCSINIHIWQSQATLIPSSSSYKLEFSLYEKLAVGTPGRVLHSTAFESLQDFINIIWTKCSGYEALMELNSNIGPSNFDVALECFSTPKAPLGFNPACIKVSFFLCNVVELKDKIVPRVTK